MTSAHTVIHEGCQAILLVKKFGIDGCCGCLAVLKKICDHPALLSERMANEVGAAGAALRRWSSHAWEWAVMPGGFLRTDAWPSSDAFLPTLRLLL